MLWIFIFFHFHHLLSLVIPIVFSCVCVALGFSRIYMSSLHFLTGVPPPASGAPAGTGWPGQSARLFHTAKSLHRIYYQTRSAHNTVVARLTPEDIKKAREAKQAQVKPVRQKVGRRN